MSESEPGIKWRRDGDPQRIEERPLGVDGMSVYMHGRYVHGDLIQVTAIAPSGIKDRLSIVQHEMWLADPLPNGIVVQMVMSTVGYLNSAVIGVSPVVWL